MYNLTNLIYANFTNYPKPQATEVKVLVTLLFH